MSKQLATKVSILLRENVQIMPKVSIRRRKNITSNNISESVCVITALSLWQVRNDVAHALHDKFKSSCFFAACLMCKGVSLVPDCVICHSHV